MSSSLRRGALAASALAFSIATLAGCAAGNNSQTLEIKPDNAAVTVGVIKIQNAVVITQPERGAEGPAAIAATVFNTGTTAQTLTGVTVDGTSLSAVLTPGKDDTASKKGSLVVPAGGSVVIGGPNNASAVLDKPGDAVKNGDAQKITFTFSDAGDVSLQAFVVPATGFYSDWGPTSVPKPSASGDSGSASAGPSESPNPSESPASGSSESSHAPATSESPSTGTGH
ncbi:copper chaperone PCu(A)C [Streptomyces roseirectus]|uniref:Copper chaperone PCu(A)C n=1 Tax=Streptomyces roseirectus TaxID=2768066 RepID=A0A7H0IGG5_9ACTN|nr:copper chaperone PCu(A)C [Streptomyces roseirectus]QNP71881.1 copper chaperone PCu(A)C [Streptomyces roseirectus]